MIILPVESDQALRIMTEPKLLITRQPKCLVGTDCSCVTNIVIGVNVYVVTDNVGITTSITAHSLVA